MELDEHRRIEDRDRVWNVRLDTMERNHVELSHQVATLETAVNTIKLEQTHLRELVGARLNTIEKTQEIGLTKMDGISHDISIMTSDVDKSPMGRTLLSYCRNLEADVSRQAEDLEKHKYDNSTWKGQVNAWQNQVMGVINILKWVGAGGLVALGFALLRLLKLLP